MKKWYVGVDGGGTKTAAAVSTAEGAVAAVHRGPGCSCQAIGVELAAERIAAEVEACLEQVGATLADCAGCCLGVPCFGESPDDDSAMAAALRARLAPAPIHVVNDVEVGWAGALACRPGIHVVAGTGSIAYGKNGEGRAARCGGWNEFFGDEGSCYWIGREAMSLFTKQADGRVPRGPLYRLVREALDLSADMGFIDRVVRELAPHRDKVAAFQKLACRAALEGDGSACALYGRAARELALMVGALCRELDLPENTAVTCSGGLFQTGRLILEPFAQEIAPYGCTLRPAEGDALQGALLLAKRQFQ